MLIINLFNQFSSKLASLFFTTCNTDSDDFEMVI